HLGSCRRAKLSGGRVSFFTALTVHVIAVARDQQDCVHVTIGKHPLASNLSTIVNVVPDPHRKAGAVEDQSVQVDDGASVLPQKRTCKFAVAWRRSAHNLATQINRQRATARIIQSSEVLHHAMSPEKSVVYTVETCTTRRIRRQISISDGFPGIIDPECGSRIPSQGT